MSQCSCCGSTIQPGSTVCPMCGVPVADTPVAPTAAMPVNPAPEAPVNPVPPVTPTPAQPSYVPPVTPAYQGAGVPTPGAGQNLNLRTDGSERADNPNAGKSKRPAIVVVSLILGILGILTSCIGLGGLFGIIALILAIVASKQQKEKDAMRTVGLILGIVSTVLTVIGTSIMVAAVAPSLIKYTNSSKKSQDVQTASTISSAIQASLAIESVYGDMGYYSGGTYSLSDDYVYLPQSFQDEVNMILGADASTLKPEYKKNNITGFSFYIDTYSDQIIVYASTPTDKQAYELSPNPYYYLDVMD